MLKERIQIPVHLKQRKTGRRFLVKGDWLECSDRTELQYNTTAGLFVVVLFTIFSLHCDHPAYEPHIHFRQIHALAEQAPQQGSHNGSPNLGARRTHGGFGSRLKNAVAAGGTRFAHLLGRLGRVVALALRVLAAKGSGRAELFGIDLLIRFGLSGCPCSKDVQAWQETSGSTSSFLSASTNFSSAIQTPALTNTPQLHELEWRFEPGLTTEQLERLQLTVKAEVKRLGQDPAVTKVGGLKIKAHCEDRPEEQEEELLPEYILTPEYLQLEILTPPAETHPEPTVEIFSCGSLGTCGLTPTRQVINLTVNNIDTVNDGNVTIQPSGAWRV